MPSNEWATVRLPPELTLAQAAEIRAALLAALGGADGLRLDLAAVAEADVAGLQLLCALHRSAAGLGKAVEVLAGHGSPVVAERADAAGFRRRRGCAEGCLWQEGAGG